MSQDNGTVILGFGATGQSVARYLRGQGVAPTVLDSRPAQALTEDWRGLEIHWHCDAWPAQVLAQGKRAVVSPGLPPHHVLVQQARQAGLQLLSDIDLFMAAVKAPVIGVTGTNGKSTVVSLVGHLLQASGRRCGIGGNLGIPVLDLMDHDNEIYVLELSSFQLAHSKQLPLASAALLNISDDHRDWHGDFEAYAAAKRRIYLNADYRVGSHQCDFPADAPCDVKVALVPQPDGWGLATHAGRPWLYRDATPLLAADQLPLAGMHNVENCLWAMALVEPWVDASLAARLLQGFTGLPHRFAEVKGPAGIRCINDSKATNVGATLAALAGYERDQQVILIAGGDSKGADLEPLGDAMHNRVRLLLTLGVNAADLNAVADYHGVPWQQVGSMDEAVAAALQHVEQGNTVLLSPACASLDMYPNFAARGEHFTALIAEHLVAVESGASV